jgi:hypothetical protein
VLTLVVDYLRSCADLQQIWHELKELQVAGVGVNQQVANAYLDRIDASGQVITRQGARNLVDLMKAGSHEPTTQFYNRLIRDCQRRRDPDEAVQWYEEQRSAEADGSLDSATWEYVISSCWRAGGFDKAWTILREGTRAAKSQAWLDKPLGAAADDLLDAHLQAVKDGRADMPEVIEMFNATEGLKDLPNTRAFGAMLSACVAAEEFVAAGEVLTRMADLRAVDAETYAKLAKAAANRGNLPLAVWYMRAMKGAALPFVAQGGANAATQAAVHCEGAYFAVLRACAVEGRAPDAQELFEACAEFAAATKRPLPPWAYRFRLDALDKGGHPDVAAAERKRWLDEFKPRMEFCARGIAPEATIALAADMEKLGIQPDRQIYDLLILAAARMRNIEAAGAYLARMRTLGGALAPTHDTLCMAIDASDARTGVQLIQLGISVGLFHRTVGYNNRQAVLDFRRLAVFANSEFEELSGRPYVSPEMARAMVHWHRQTIKTHVIRLAVEEHPDGNARKAVVEAARDVGWELVEQPDNPALLGAWRKPQPKQAVSPLRSINSTPHAPR